MSGSFSLNLLHLKYLILCTLLMAFHHNVCVSLQGVGPDGPPVSILFILYNG